MLSRQDSICTLYLICVGIIVIGFLINKCHPQQKESLLVMNSWISNLDIDIRVLELNIVPAVFGISELFLWSLVHYFPSTLSFWVSCKTWAISFHSQVYNHSRDFWSRHAWTFKVTERWVGPLKIEDEWINSGRNQVTVIAY